MILLHTRSHKKTGKYDLLFDNVWMIQFYKLLQSYDDMICAEETKMKIRCIIKASKYDDGKERRSKKMCMRRCT